MSVPFALILVGLFCGSVNGCATNNYELYFQSGRVWDYAQLWGMRSLDAFTVCLWVNSKDGGHDTAIFSYARRGQDNELIIDGPRNFDLFIGDEERKMHVSTNDGRWHHICFTWRGSDGTWKFYKNGTLHKHGLGFKRGYFIRARGSLVLAQEQDSLGGSFDATQSFQGALTNVNVWSYELPSSTIKWMSKSCLRGKGNVYKWSDFRVGVKGGTRVYIPTHCRPLGHYI